MKNINLVVLTGRFGRDPEIKMTRTDKKVLSGSIAVNGFKENETHWIELQAWEKVAEIIGKYCSKGSKITVTGELKTSTWEDQSGQKKYKTYVLVTGFEFMCEKPKGDSDQQQNSQQNQYDNDDVDDIPF